MKNTINSMDRIINLVGQEKADKMCAYMDAILEKNEHINLTAVRDRDEFISKHLLDSLSCIAVPEFEKSKTVIDIGTGAGFPGVPLAIACPGKKFLLVDSLNKRLKIIKELTEELGIDNVEVMHTRAEDAAKNPDYRDNFDVCVSRAVASLDVLTEWCMPFVRKGGYFIPFKGAKAEEEINDAEAAIKTLGGKYNRSEMFLSEEEGSESHTLVIIDKIKPTPKRFPRKAGEARKNPIK